MPRDNRAKPATPRWVKAFAIVAAILVVLLLVMVLTGIGGPHGPGRHLAG